MKIVNYLRPKTLKSFNNLKIGQCCFATYDNCEPFVAMVIDGHELVVNITDSELYEINDPALEFIEEIPMDQARLIIGKPE